MNVNENGKLNYIKSKPIEGKILICYRQHLADWAIFFPIEDICLACLHDDYLYSIEVAAADIILFKDDYNTTLMLKSKYNITGIVSKNH